MRRRRRLPDPISALSTSGSWRQGALLRRQLLHRPAIAVRPVRTHGTDLALGIVGALFVRAADDAGREHHRFHAMLLEELVNLVSDGEIVPDVVRLGGPAFELRRLRVFVRDDANGYLAGTGGVGSVEGQRPCGKASMATLRFLLQPSGASLDFHVVAPFTQ